MPMGFNPGDPSLKYDLVIAGGEVLDPSQNLRGKRDVGIKYGQIAAIAPGIPADRAVQRIDAGGKLVTPGLVDLHTHLCPHLGIGLPADELVQITAVTTAVSAGDAGAHTFGNFRHGVVPQSRTRLFGFVHIASIGLAGGLAPGEMLNIDYANVEACAKAVAENPDLVLGVKVRITDSVVGQNGLEPLRRALTAAEMAIAQGLTPDAISSDIHAVSINTPGYPTLPWVMSKFLNMGLSLEDVVAKATVEPAKVIGRVPGLGTLQVGAPADVAIFDLVDGPVEFVDTRNHKRSGTRKLVPALTVRGGRPFGRPPLPIPFLY